jgi:hypothetical protein
VKLGRTCAALAGVVGVVVVALAGPATFASAYKKKVDGKDVTENVQYLLDHDYLTQVKPTPVAR